MTQIEIPAEISADDLETFPDAGYRYELHEGNLVLMSPLAIWHNNAAFRLVGYFRAQGRDSAGAVGIKFGPRDVRIPDVSVFHRPVDDDYRFALDRSAEGEPVYKQNGRTTLSELEKGNG